MKKTILLAIRKLAAPCGTSVVLLGMALFLASSCSKPAKITEVRIGTMGDAVDYAPFMIAREKGLFEQAFKKFGIEKVEYTTFQSLPALNETLGANRLDIIFEAEPPAILARAAGNDLRIVGISCSLVQEILIRSNSPVAQISDLRGKKATVPAGTSSHYNLLAILASANLSDTDVQIIDMSPPDAKNAFETDQVDAWAIWPPWVEQQIVSGKGRVLPGTQAQIHSIMSLRGKFQDDNPDIARVAFQVLEDSKAWIRQNPKEAQELAAKALKLDIKVINLAWPKHDWTAKLSESVITDVQAKADFLNKRGLIKTPINVKSQLIFPYPVVK